MSKYPDIEVELIGQDGNAYNLLGRVVKALKSNEVSQDEINQFLDEATESDYDNLLRVIMGWVEVI